jgi:hypothetical protein
VEIRQIITGLFKNCGKIANILETGYWVPHAGKPHKIADNVQCDTHIDAETLGCQHF